MEKSRGKEIKLKIDNSYKTSYGTVDSKNPKAIYIKISAWGLPTDEDENDYNGVIRKLNKRLRLFVYNNLDEKIFDKKNNIVDLDMRESGIIFNKKSFMSCEITLFQKNNYEFTSPLIMKHLTDLTTKLINEEFVSNKNFTFYKNKK